METYAQVVFTIGCLSCGYRGIGVWNSYSDGEGIGWISATNERATEERFMFSQTSRLSASRKPIRRERGACQRPSAFF